MIAPIQITKMKYLIYRAFEFLDFFLTIKFIISCTPHPGQNHEQ